MNKKIRDFITMTLGTLIVSVGVYFFKFPNNFSTGGVSGISVLLGSLIEGISTSQLVLIINCILLAVGFVFIGRSFGGNTVYCSLLLSLSVNIYEKLFPLASPMTDQPLLELFFAVLLPSFGSALLFYSDASTGGTDIIAMVFKKYTNMDIGNALFYSDVVIACSTFFVFGMKTGLFSVLGLLSKSVVVNWVMNGLTLSKNCTIITSAVHCHEVCTFITSELHRGATIMDCKGFYSDENKKAVISVIRKNQLVSLRDSIKAVDPHAFIIVTDTNQIFGRGFATI